ncbi:omega-amino acid-pyruvate aminotransferase [Plenodomus tracheiphilus IPT5]|uniref:Omega-amino acid-pyruvate aminotransferase n=1 Tax=Plenodomus tracheiphilus IPT5 TaxID=1408161 RepID=A0A6A7ARL2_9PLEO|nr:omega-amino acid-pyruvate aminotransferase [Plenodomus tracheiphilus IPT5]
MAPHIFCNESDTSSFNSDSDADSFTSGINVPNSLATKTYAPLRNKRRSHLMGSKAKSGTKFYAEKAEGNWIWVADDRGQRRIFDACGGAAVSCIGHNHPRVPVHIKELCGNINYVASAHFDTHATEECAGWLAQSTGYELDKVLFYNSGSESVEAALKLAYQWHSEAKPYPEPSRQLFIARDRSYHGTTLGSLDMSGHKARKQPFHGILPGNASFISPCYAFRGMTDEETKAQYVKRLADELENEIIRLGPKNVAAFIMEPVVGAALGCAPALPGYLKAMKAVCRKYGVLIIFDEVMCGMGRTGYLHAWQKEGVVPDIQVVGKGLTGGYAVLSAILMSPKISDAFEDREITFNHGHTYQNYPPACNAALVVQRIIQDEGFLANVREKGELLRKRLAVRLLTHPNVGDIRGDGLFWGIEFVFDKLTKEPFPSQLGVAKGIHTRGLTSDYGIDVYPGSGTVDGESGDHIIIAPAFNITEDDVDIIVERVGRLIEDFFENLFSAKAVL